MTNNRNSLFANPSLMFESLSFIVRFTKKLEKKWREQQLFLIMKVIILMQFMKPWLHV